MDPRSETLLKEYNKEVEKLARGIYLQLISIRRDIDESRINPDDKYAILLNSIHILTKPVLPEEAIQAAQQERK